MRRTLRRVFVTDRDDYDTPVDVGAVDFSVDVERPTPDAGLVELDTAPLAYSLGPTYTTYADSTEVPL